jgi:hypothetical protein
MSTRRRCGVVSRHVLHEMSRRRMKVRVPGEAGEDEADGEAAGAWEQAANDAPHVETRETLLKAVREGGPPAGQRPVRQCRRVEPYGR